MGSSRSASLCSWRIALLCTILIGLPFLWSYQSNPAHTDADTLAVENRATKLVNSLLRDPASLRPPAGQLNSTLCAIATAEDHFIEEWLIYHRLLGFQQFYLYPFEKDMALANLLAPWIEAGIVVLHMITFEDEAIPSRNFFPRFAEHCASTYGSRTQWMWAYDVDEFLQISDVHGLPTAPWQDEGSSVWRYPLHELLLSPPLSQGRCVTVTRKGFFVNVGLIDAPARSSILQHQVFRSLKTGTPGAGKPLLRSSTGGVLAKVIGHTCESVAAAAPAGSDVTGHEQYGAYRDAQGSAMDSSYDPSIYEPLSLAHYGQRTLADCKRKLSHIHDPENWRVQAGGEKQCSSEYVMTKQQLASKFFRSDPHWTELSSPRKEMLVRDTNVRDSWYGRSTVTALARLRKAKTLPCRDGRKAISQVIFLKEPNPRSSMTRDVQSFKRLLKSLVTTPDSFTFDDLNEAIEHVSHPDSCTPAQVSAWLTALHLQGKDRDPEILAAYAERARSKAVQIILPNRSERPQDWVCDIVGTGGDGQDTFNGSTAASIVAAGAGLRVCKHGSKASTSTSGSADFLTALGCPVMALPPDNVPTDSPYLFLFAMLYHPTFAITSPVRKELGFPTIYNILGPLINPAQPDAVLYGVYSPDLGMIYAKALQKLNIRRAWVVCGFEGLDEISPAGNTHVWDLALDGSITYKTVSPADFGLATHSLDTVRGSEGADANAAIFRELLSQNSDLASPIATFVLLNTAALLFIAGKAQDLKEGVRLAKESITSGSAAQILANFARLTTEALAKAQQASNS